MFMLPVEGVIVRMWHSVTYSEIDVFFDDYNLSLCRSEAKILYYNRWFSHE